jgi:hypothetical protein
MSPEKQDSQSLIKPMGNDHDLLITIAANVDNLNRSFLSHLDSSSSTHAKLETLQQGNDDKLETVHRRIDGLQVTGVLAIISFIITIILAVFVKGPTMPKEINLKVSDEQVRVFAEQVNNARPFRTA